jgi:hypothetical protein
MYFSEVAKRAGAAATFDIDDIAEFKRKHRAVDLPVVEA